MNMKKYAAIILCIMAVAISSFVFSRSTRSAPNTQVSASQQTGGIPDHVVYRMFLHDIVVRNEAAQKAENKGEHASAAAWRKTYKDQAALSDVQMLVLSQIAEDCEREVKQQDKKAKAFIDTNKARFPGGVVPKGYTLTPSPELIAMQEERNRIILRARDRIREAFGKQEFARFSKFLEQNVASKITRK